MSLLQLFSESRLSRLPVRRQIRVCGHELEANNNNLSKHGTFGFWGGPRLIRHPHCGLLWRLRLRSERSEEEEDQTIKKLIGVGPTFPSYNYQVIKEKTVLSKPPQVLLLTSYLLLYLPVDQPLITSYSDNRWIKSGSFLDHDQRL